MKNKEQLYLHYKNALKGIELPAMLVDVERFDANTDLILNMVKKANKFLRPASKSIRVPALLKRLAHRGKDTVRGLMCFSIFEAELLYHQGFNNLYVAYPIATATEIEKAIDLHFEGVELYLTVDSLLHVELLKKHIQKHSESQNFKPLNVVIDVDMSLRALGGHLGVRRSPIHTLEQFEILALGILATPQVKLSGVMGYEAQIAGLGDNNPFAPILNLPKKIIRNQSMKSVAKFRGAISEWLNKNHIKLDFFNGGGTGSLDSTLQEPWLTEVTAGSGFLQSHLFDYYTNTRGTPALTFALPICRFPSAGIATAKSGGFIASGDSSKDKAPLPYLPEGLSAFKEEGFGEVQTPFLLPGTHSFQLGDPLFMRPSKAGEIAERFDHYYLLYKDHSIEKVSTYRGLNGNFF